ncbi:hypothetical protein Q5752_006344 [Cryptotrichosporon argae]
MADPVYLVLCLTNARLTATTWTASLGCVSTHAVPINGELCLSWLCRALDALFPLLSLSTITHVAGCILSAYLAVPPGWLRLVASLDSAPLGAQLVADAPAAAPAVHPAHWAADEVYPLGYVLSSLLCQGPGSCGRQELEMLASRGGVEGVVGHTGEYWAERYGLRAALIPFLPTALAAHFSASPRPDDLVVCLDDADHIVLPLSGDGAGPADLPVVRAMTGHKVAVVVDANGPQARMYVRDRYGNGRWDTTARLALAFPPGGSLGADNKRYSFMWKNPVATPVGMQSGTTRFERGVLVDEFKDLRANARCVLESQAFAMREMVRVAESRPSRVVLLGSEGRENFAFAHVLAQVFDLAVVTATSTYDPPALGAAMYARQLAMSLPFSLPPSASPRIKDRPVAPHTLTSDLHAVTDRTPRPAPLQLPPIGLMTPPPTSPLSPCTPTQSSASSSRVDLLARAEATPVDLLPRAEVTPPATPRVRWAADTVARDGRGDKGDFGGRGAIDSRRGDAVSSRDLEEWMSLVVRKPDDSWTAGLYGVMAVEWARLRGMVYMGLI